MVFEDLGYNPCETQPQRQKELITKRIEENRILISKIENRIAFQIEVGVMLSVGCQVGSTYIPISFRGKGLSAQYMRGACGYLLEKTQKKVRTKIIAQDGKTYNEDLTELGLQRVRKKDSVFEVVYNKNIISNVL